MSHSKQLACIFLFVLLVLFLGLYTIDHNMREMTCWQGQGLLSCQVKQERTEVEFLGRGFTINHGVFMERVEEFRSAVLARGREKILLLRDTVEEGFKEISTKAEDVKRGLGEAIDKYWPIR